MNTKTSHSLLRPSTAAKNTETKVQLTQPTMDTSRLARNIAEKLIPKTCSPLLLLRAPSSSEDAPVPFTISSWFPSHWRLACQWTFVLSCGHVSLANRLLYCFVNLSTIPQPWPVDPYYGTVGIFRKSTRLHFSKVWLLETNNGIKHCSFVDFWCVVK